jgi:hypothetical protein
LSGVDYDVLMRLTPEQILFLWEEKQAEDATRRGATASDTHKAIVGSIGEAGHKAFTAHMHGLEREAKGLPYTVEDDDSDAVQL